MNSLKSCVVTLNESQFWISLLAALCTKSSIPLAVSVKQSQGRRDRDLTIGEFVQDREDSRAKYSVTSLMRNSDKNSPSKRESDYIRFEQSSDPWNAEDLARAPRILRSLGQMEQSKISVCSICSNPHQ